MSDLLIKVRDSYATLESIGLTLGILVNAKKDIVSRGCISQEMAVGLEAVSVGTVSRKTPINSFTVEPSYTNYEITVESISETLKKMRDQIVEAFRKLIAKVKAWFKATFRDSKKNTDKAKASVKEAEMVFEKLQALEAGIAIDLLSYWTETSSTKGGKVPTMQDIITELHSGPVGVLENCITRNVYVTARGQGWHTLFKNMVGVKSVLQDMSGKLEKLTSAVNSGSELDEDSYRVGLAPLVGLINNDTQTLEASMDNIRNLKKYAEKASSQKFSKGEMMTLGNPTVQEFLRNEGRIAEALDNINSVIETESTLDAVQSNLEKLEKSLAKIENSEHATKVNGIFNSFKSVFFIVNTIYETLDMLQKQFFKYAEGLMNAAKLHHKALLSAIKDLPKDQREKWENELNDKKLTTSLESIEQGYDDLSHEVPDDEREALYQALQDSGSELDQLSSTQAALESLGLEGIVENVKAMASKTVAAIKAMIKRMVEWFKSLFKKKETAKAAKETAKEAESTAKTTSDAVDEFAAAVDETLNRYNEAMAEHDAKATEIYKRAMGEDAPTTNKPTMEDIIQARTNKLVLKYYQVGLDAFSEICRTNMVDKYISLLDPVRDLFRILPDNIYAIGKDYKDSNWTARGLDLKQIVGVCNNIGKITNTLAVEASRPFDHLEPADDFTIEEVITHIRSAVLSVKFVNNFTTNDKYSDDAAIKKTSKAFSELLLKNSDSVIKALDKLEPAKLLKDIDVGIIEEALFKAEDIMHEMDNNRTSIRTMSEEQRAARHAFRMYIQSVVILIGRALAVATCVVELLDKLFTGSFQIIDIWKRYESRTASAILIAIKLAESVKDSEGNKLLDIDHNDPKYKAVAEAAKDDTNKNPSLESVDYSSNNRSVAPV